MNENGQDKTALLLDDNLMSATRVQKQLERAGFRAQTARVLPKEIGAPNLVLINLGSRSLHGVELIAASRAQYPAARVLGFCGHAEIEIRRAAKAAGLERIFTNEEAMMELAALLGK